MSTLYWDPTNGIPNADGLTYATRFKYLFQLPAQPATIDEIKIIENVPQSIGDIQWTDLDNTVVPAVPFAIKEIYPAWETTAATSLSTGVTLVNIAANPVQAAVISRMNVAAAAAVGKLAYWTLPAPVDVSGFDFFSMRGCVGLNLSSGHFRLCSDALGVDTVVTIDNYAASVVDPVNLPPLGGALSGTWERLVSYLDAPLPPGTVINSIAVDMLVDFTGSAYYANLIGGLQSAGINHSTLISKMTADEPEWYPVTFIGENRLTLGAVSDYVNQLGTDANPALQYITESVESFSTIPHRFPVNSAYRNLAGSSSNRINKITGGWDAASMSAVTGKSFLDKNLQVSVIIVSTRQLTDDSSFDDLYFIRLNSNHTIFSTAHPYNINRCGLIDADAVLSGSATPALNSPVTRNYHWDMAVRCVHTAVPTQMNLGVAPWPITVDLVSGSTGIAGFRVSDNTVPSANALILQGGTRVKKLKTNTVNQMHALGGGSIIGPIEIIAGPRVTAQLHTSGASAQNLPSNFIRMPEFYSFTSGAVADNQVGSITFANGVHYLTHVAFSQSDVVDTEPKALCILNFDSVASTVAVLRRSHEIAQIAVVEGVPVTVTCRVNNPAGGRTGLALPNWIEGETPYGQYVETDLTGWQTVTMTFTPAQSGVVSIYAITRSSSGNRSYFSGLTWE